MLEKDYRVRVYKLWRKKVCKLHFLMSRKRGVLYEQKRGSIWAFDFCNPVVDV